MKFLYVIAVFATVSISIASTSIISEVAKRKTWYKLLNFDESKQVSRIINPSFFLSPIGNIDPEAELEATLAYIEKESLDTPETKRFACLFPARKRFLEKDLNVSVRLKCPSLEEWFERLSMESVSFIFSSQYMGNPASIMGHSFLRFDGKRRTNLLGTALSFVAKSDPNDGSLSYIFKGLFGGYPGIYQLDAFYPKNHLYGSIENRDLWEYKLNLSPRETMFIFEHALELSRSGQEDYYFLDRNCSYVLLELISLSRENLHLAKEGDRLFITPQQSIKILSRYNLIKEEIFKPSMRRKASAHYDALDGNQKNIFKLILQGKVKTDDVKDSMTFSALTSFLTMKKISADFSMQEEQVLHEASNARSYFSIDRKVSDNLYFENKNRGPLYGHDLMQSHIGIATSDKTSGLQIGFRVAGHALDDLPIGLLPNTQIVFLDTVLRIEEIHTRPMIRLRQLSLIDIKSLPAFTLVNNQVSWTTQLALFPTLGSQCVDCRATRAAGAIGYSSKISERVQVFSLVGLNIDFFKPKNNLELRTGP